MLACWLIAVILVRHASAATAQIMPVSQERSLTVHADLELLYGSEVIPAELVASVPALSPGGLALLVLTLAASAAPFTRRRRG